MLSTKLKLLCTMNCKTHIAFMWSAFKEVMLSNCSRYEITLENINKSSKNTRASVTGESFFLNNVARADLWILVRGHSVVYTCLLFTAYNLNVHLKLRQE